MPGRGASATPGSARAAPPAAPRAVGGREVGALRAAPPTGPSEEALRTRCEPIANPLRAMGAQRVAAGAQRATELTRTLLNGSKGKLVVEVTWCPLDG